TTRDVLTVRTAFDGWPVELCDTAGLRGTSDPLEALGVARAQTHQASADQVLLVFDRSAPLAPPDLELLAAHPRALRVANKCDLPAAWDPADLNALDVSAERGDGVERLISAIAHNLVPTPPPPGSAVPFRERHRRLLRHARRLLGERPDTARRALLCLGAAGGRTIAKAYAATP